MMSNLFSTFDPSTGLFFSLNWTSTFIIILLFPNLYWLFPTRNSILFLKMSNNLHTEFKTLLGEGGSGLSIMFVTLFMFILFNNLFGLIPYIFTSSSHLTFSLALSLPIWLSFMMFGWINMTQNMLAHLIPPGTPSALMPFMVLIETISNIIRPGSLAVRLTANMIAGHLLMSLLGNNLIENSNLTSALLIMIQMMLMLFESAVSMIQAYVFSVLSTLYSSEVIYENK
uniref:ATP synthase subunit a n=1 Tax=Alloeorhynchus bakeri TaxID=796621 RepID=G9B4I7_9HEMI|nr:ATP synthase F0 subunit 6 [Alloeorhynchus bakeri]ADI75223.1 ATP synthase F0 subunit 6 [Alloeorhynchus bakeri]